MTAASEHCVLSICVCTRNRAHLLERTLRSLVEQLYPRVEIIVVDNCSIDATREIVQQFVRAGHLLRHCVESVVGLSRARNRGWREASAQYVGYIDDDAVAHRDWIATALSIVASDAPDAFGGPYFACYDSPKPAWYRDNYYSHWQGDVARTLRSDEYLDGTNMFVRRDILERLGGFDPAFGMQGHTLSYGEETDFLDRLRRSMPDAVVRYDPRLAVDHLVPAYKMTLRWIAQSAVAEGRINYRLFERNRARRNRFRATRALAGFLHDYTIGVAARDRREYPFAGSFLHDRTLSHGRNLGAALEERRDKGPR